MLYSSLPRLARTMCVVSSSAVATVTSTGTTPLAETDVADAPVAPMFAVVALTVAGTYAVAVAGLFWNAVVTWAVPEFTNVVRIFFVKMSVSKRCIVSFSMFAIATTGLAVRLNAPLAIIDLVIFSAALVQSRYSSSITFCICATSRVSSRSTTRVSPQPHNTAHSAIGIIFFIALSFGCLFILFVSPWYRGCHQKSEHRPGNYRFLVFLHGR